MSLQLSEEIRALLAPGAAIKVLATVGENGLPQVVFDDQIYLDTEGRLVYRELVEHAPSNKNLVRAIWFSRQVSVALRAPDGRSFQILATPYKAVITGPIFEAHYRQVRAARSDVDLSTVWLLEPQSWSEESYEVRRETAEIGRLPLVHLDCIARPQAA